MKRLVSLILTAALLWPMMALGTVQAAPDVGCSWPLRLNEDTYNVAYPDDSADYWVAHLPFARGTHLKVTGYYPYVRYFSFHAYDEAQRPVGAIADYEIVPGAGSDNPFVSGAGPSDLEERRYTVRVRFEEEPQDPQPNTIYAGRMDEGLPNPSGYVIYRIYVPDNAASEVGEVPLPKLALVSGAGRAEIPLGDCRSLPPEVMGGINERTSNDDFPDAIPRLLPAADNPPVFYRFFGLDQVARNEVPPENDYSDPGSTESEGGFFSNQHIAYLYARTSRHAGDVLVVRAKAPTFPDTRAGEPTTLSTQLRYWSVCQNNGASQRVVDCTADYQTPLDAEGNFTVVVSDPGDRPENATAANGVAWLPWGELYYEGAIIYRHMLPAAGFDHAIQNIPQAADPADVMGEYMPIARYCTTQRFEAGGPDACLP